MALQFNATTTRLTHATATGYQVAIRTLVAWCFPTSAGEGGQGTLFVVDEVFGASAKWGVRFNTTGSSLIRYISVRATLSGAWEWDMPFNQWNALAVSYDSGSTANDPIVRQNFAPVATVEAATPSGGEGGGATGYCIGNVSGATRTWDGRLQHMQVFNVELTADEMDAALRRPGSIRRGLVSWWPMWDGGHDEDLVNVAFQPTLTAGANGDGAPCQGLWFGQPQGWMGNFTTPAAAPPAADGWGPLFAFERRRLLYGG